MALATLCLAACGDEADPGPEPPVEVLPEAPEPEYTDGHWAKAQRGIALDEDDLPVIQANAGLPPERLETDFGLLVLNRPYVDWRASICPRSNEAPNFQPLATAERFIASLKADKGVEYDRVAVNVDLLSPARRSLLYVCFDRGAPDPLFEVVEHREKIVAAFTDLAGLADLEYITVGLEMNRYYHLESGKFRADYANWVTLYREVYDAIKAVNPDIKVGPGLSWAVLMTRTAPEIATVMGLEDGSVEAVYRAYQRTVAPLLSAGRGTDRRVTADFIGFSIVPFGSEPPFQGQPAPEDESAKQAILDYYLLLPVVAAGLPVTFPQIDWAVESGSTASLKGPFLTSLKHATSHVDVAWAAWRRLADLPRQPAEANPCVRYTGSTEATLRYPIDYCSAGMIEPSGKVRDVLDIFTTDP